MGSNYEGRRWLVLVSALVVTEAVQLEDEPADDDLRRKCMKPST